MGGAVFINDVISGRPSQGKWQRNLVFSVLKFQSVFEVSFFCFWCVRFFWLKIFNFDYVYWFLFKLVNIFWVLQLPTLLTCQSLDWINLFKKFLWIAFFFVTSFPLRNWVFYLFFVHTKSLHLFTSFKFVWFWWLSVLSRMWYNSLSNSYLQWRAGCWCVNDTVRSDTIINSFRVFKIPGFPSGKDNYSH